MSPTCFDENREERASSAPDNPALSAQAEETRQTPNALFKIGHCGIKVPYDSVLYLDSFFLFTQEKEIAAAKQVNNDFIGHTLTCR